MSQAYFNSHASTWDETAVEKDPAKLTHMVARFNLKQGSTLLDVGTGTGVLLPFLVRVVGRSGWVIGLDYAELMLRQAIKKHCSGNIAYLLADIGAIPARSGSFEAVVCYSCFPHFQDKPQVLSEIRRTMKPGGQLFICHTSGREQINHIHRQIPPVCHDALPENREMHHLLENVGFVHINIEDEADSYLAVAEKL